MFLKRKEFGYWYIFLKTIPMLGQNILFDQNFFEIILST